MICRKCGHSLAPDVSVCKYCGEPVPGGVVREESAGLLRGRVHVDGKTLPKLVPLHKLAPVPATKEQTLAELRRLEKYFWTTRDKYGVLHDLDQMQERWRAPSFLRWGIAGGLASVLVYILLGPYLPQGFQSLFFIVWCAVTCIGYITSGRRYERETMQMANDIRNTENAIRKTYNAAPDCFLPLDYTEPRVMHELIVGLDTQAIASFEDYRLSR